MKRILTLVLTMMLLAGVLVLSAAAAETTKTAECPYCEKEVTWTAWTKSNTSSVDVEAGHYYLSEDLPSCVVKRAIGTVCIDLNGHTMKSRGRSLIVSGAYYTEGTPIINVMDSQGGGCIVGTDYTNNPNGGTAYVVDGGVLNLYGGTLKHITDGTNSVTELGGVVCLFASTKAPVGGTLNIYGGTIDASECTMKEYGEGAAVHVGKLSTVNAYGGTILGGQITGDEKLGECVYLELSTSKLLLTGNAAIDEIRFATDPQNVLTVSGTYTGRVTLAYADGTIENEGFVTGQITNNADVSGADMRSVAEGYFVDIMGGQLVLTRIDPSCEASVIDASNITNCETLEEALSIANGKRIQLNRSISRAVSIDQDTYLDLNGYDITGKVTVDDKMTLYCMDSETDDYTVANEKGELTGYGTLTNVEGTVRGLPLDTGIAVDAYMMITDDGEISFHRIGLSLTAMTLRSNVAGVYYKSAFGVDEMVADRIAGYGVALSVYAEPTKDNLDTQCKYSYFSNFSAGGLDTNATSTLLSGVMKEGNSDFKNNRNANMPVYGRAYFLLKDGSYLFGSTADRSFKEQVEAVSDIWDLLTKNQKDEVDAMYSKYRSLIDNWDAVNIHAYKDPSRDNVLKVLNISNSHGQDSVWLIPEVLKAETPDTEFLVAECYASYALAEHIQAAQKNSADYKYYTNSGDGWSEGVYSTSLQALQAQNWDIVMFNESSRHLGLEKYGPSEKIDWFRNYILENLDYEPTLLYNMTWASPTDMNLYNDDRQPAPDYFINTYTNDYGFDHVNHYNCLVAMTEKYLVKHEGFDKIIYNATPVQYASEICGVPQYDVNQTFDLYRDYTHLSDFARLIVAYNWYCQMFEIDELSDVKVNVIKADDRAEYSDRQKVYGDLTLTEDHKNVLIESVNHGLKNPLSIPEIAE